MNQTIQEAADRYASKEILKVMGKMPSGYAGGLSVGFVAGAIWAELKWIPVTERLPESMQQCLFVVSLEADHDNGRILGGWYTGRDFVTPGVGWKASHWCAIPDSPLNFKP